MLVKWSKVSVPGVGEEVTLLDHVRRRTNAELRDEARTFYITERSHEVRLLTRQAENVTRLQDLLVFQRQVRTGDGGGAGAATDATQRRLKRGARRRADTRVVSLRD